ncbi:hypothetical protein IFT67_10105 [Sphingomonas sp. CFBP 13728]|uniref:hypothetical protein n=1 Tax=Sphingomonas sp. CFBP 13728 TaxID=2775294 RepID=UPI001785BC36|nr:hypothetical protein [Sphingomonas sp. CFBP 13728]MBD8619273.1 hypothetical protein [Sphingomonas sp. CFBP 13728]
MVKFARTWQPGRLKGIQVSPEFGTPFLAATQVFDVRPVARKWLSLNRTGDYVERYVREGTIMLTCSGSVGRATPAFSSVSDTLISHDLLRIEAIDERDQGWIYAYLRAPTIRAMMTSAQYGHMIKHLEVGHLDSMPFIECPSQEIRDQCQRNFKEVISARNEAAAAIVSAEAGFQGAFETTNLIEDNGESGFNVSSRALVSGRRRFDATSVNPRTMSIEQNLALGAVRMQSLRDLECQVWLPNRFRRVPAEEGVYLVDSSSIFEINPDPRRRISAEAIVDRNGGFVEENWLLMSRSGQVYGLLGSVALATANHAGKVVTDDIIRIVAGENLDPGYLHLCLSDERLGRPRIKSLAYGSSIPHIEVEDLLDMKIPRFDQEFEGRLGALVQFAYKRWAEADELENQLSDLAEEAISAFLSTS